MGSLEVEMTLQMFNLRECSADGRISTSRTFYWKTLRGSLIECTIAHAGEARQCGHKHTMAYFEQEHLIG